MAEAHSFPRTDALDVIVELISELDERPRPGARGFYDRLCEALCRQASMKRAGLMLYDDARRLVVPVGSHGLEAELLANVYGSLEETPIAQAALSQDRVVQVSSDLDQWVPARYVGFAQLNTLTCTPVSAGGRWLGVIFADRGGEPFELNDDERSAMWTIGKTAALAASVRIATNQQGRARLLQARIDLAREIHEGVVQRLFGISLALGAEHGLSDEARRRCADEMQAALADLRDALERPLAPAPVDTGVTLRRELDRLGGRYKDTQYALVSRGSSYSRGYDQDGYTNPFGFRPFSERPVGGDWSWGNGWGNQNSWGQNSWGNQNAWPQRQQQVVPQRPQQPVQRQQRQFGREDDRAGSRREPDSWWSNRQ